MAKGWKGIQNKGCGTHFVIVLVEEVSQTKQATP